MPHTAVILANSDAVGAPIVQRGALAASYDSGALVIWSDRSPYHQLDLDTAAVSGTFAIAIRPAGSAEWRTLAETIDLSDASTLLVVIENVALDALRLTPSGVAADTDYTVAVNRHA